MKNAIKRKSRFMTFLWLMFVILLMSEAAYAATSNEKKVEDYSYKIIPLLEPFNEYFLVKTDNPNPVSFRFIDTTTGYGEKGTISLLSDSISGEPVRFADVKYENEKTGRVNGGYIFCGSQTDGGKVTLQSYSPSLYSESWKNTKTSFTLPALKDVADYLIDTYARKSDFFDNMDAVQAGFSSICFYCGSHIRGTLIKPNDYWFITTPGHSDQGVYLSNPYDREDSVPLFASDIYPFRYDSLGFPSVMAEVAKRLSASAEVAWSSTSHAHIEVTYKGETRTYGGQGGTEGQGITRKDIKEYFTFGESQTKYTLKSIQGLLNDYAALKIENDIPQKGSISWKSICDQVGAGAWVRINDCHWIVNGKYNFGADTVAYSYFYKRGDGNSFSDDNINWWGDLANPRDSWVDGRYVNKFREYVPGEKFQDHPTSDIVLFNVKMPNITYDTEYKYDEATSSRHIQYKNVKNEPKATTVVFSYDEEKKLWIAKECADKDCMGYADVHYLIQSGVIDKAYYDVVTLTLEKVKKLSVDRNTDKAPEKGYIYDGTEEPGTKYDESVAHSWLRDWDDIDATCTTDGKESYTCIVCKKKRSETIQAAGHKFSAWNTTAAATALSAGSKERTCSVCGQKETVSIKKLTPKLKLGKTAVKIAKTKSVFLKVTFAKGDKVFVKSSNRKIAATKFSGSTLKITAGKKAGTAKITVSTRTGRKATVKVTVPKVKTTKITCKKVSVKKGKKVTLKPVVKPAYTDDKLTFKSANKKIATVNRKGVVIGKKKGSTYITVKSGKKSVKVKVVVK